MTPDSPLITALRPVWSRVRRDITACKNAAGVQAWTKQPLTRERLAAHLNGGPSRGVCPIKAGESVTLLAVLDFDSHKGETSWVEMSMVVGRVMGAMTLAWGAEPIAFRSSGGRGVHLYVLWDDPQDAYSVRQWLLGILEGCGLRSGNKGVRDGCVEVFPKQDSVPLNGNGSQFILPLAGQSELLALDELSGLLVPVSGGKDAILGLIWLTSPPVLLQERPIRVERAANAAEDDITGLWRSALDAIPNGRGDSEALGYDDWFKVVCGVHHEMGGADAGLALVEEFSQRAASKKTVSLEFLWERVWPYVKTGAERGGPAITGRTIMSIAARYGWRAPIDVSGFVAEADEDAEPDEEVEQVHGGAVSDPGTVATGVPGGKDPLTKPVRRSVPPAEYRTTDQANAVRLVLAYGRRALSAADRWYVDDGKCWVIDDAGVCRYTCMLSKIVGDEARRSEIEEAKESNDV